MQPHRRSQRVAMITEGPSGRLKLCGTTTMSRDPEKARHSAAAQQVKVHTADVVRHRVISPEAF